MKKVNIQREISTVQNRLSYPHFKPLECQVTITFNFPLAREATRSAPLL